jgi:hypothetical protein
MTTAATTISGSTGATFAVWCESPDDRFIPLQDIHRSPNT